MSKLRLQYLSNFKKSLKMALDPSSLPCTVKIQHCENNPISHTSYDVISANKAITSHCRTGALDHARHLFDAMPERTVVSWNTMITGYSKHHMLPESLALISLMHHSSIKPNETTFSITLSVCGRAQSLSDGKQVHGQVLKSGHHRFKLVGSALLYVYSGCCQILDARKVFDELIQENELLWSLMLAGYVECNLMNKALNLFDEMPRRGVVEWTALISGYTKNGDGDGCKKALELFKAMREDCEDDPNEFTLDSLVRACTALGDLSRGREIHGLIMKSGFEHDHSINGALICFYGRCGSMDAACKVHDRMDFQGPDETNELIGGFVNSGRVKEAESVFINMPEKNPISYNLMLKGYAVSGLFEDSERLFSQMPIKILSSLNTMISVYSKKGEVGKALEIFEKAKDEESPITWNSMISGYVHNNLCKDALRLYLNMRRSSISETRSTFSALFHACACLGSLQQGQVLHSHLLKSPFSSDVYVGTSLIDMYSKCGTIDEAESAFKSVRSPNVAAWTALINGYAHHCPGLKVISLFNLMVRKNGVSPNEATFVAVLSGCARAGLVEKGMRLFRSMEEFYHVKPTLEHITCVVDLLGRAGLLKEAEEIIEMMGIEADEVLLISLMHASWFWMDVELGERVAEKMKQSWISLQSACVIMSNVYSGSGKWGEKMKVRDVLRGLGGKKDQGCSWIDVRNRTHVFCVGDKKHTCSDLIYANLESLNVNANYNNEFEFFSS